MDLDWPQSSQHLQKPHVYNIIASYIFKITVSWFAFFYGTTTRLYHRQNGAVIGILSSSGLLIVVLYALLSTKQSRAPRWKLYFKSFLYTLILLEAPTYLFFGAAGILVESPLVGCHTRPWDQKDSSNYANSGAAAGVIIMSVFHIGLLYYSWIDSATTIVFYDSESKSIGHKPKFHTFTAAVSVAVVLGKVYCGQVILEQIGEPNCFWLVGDLANQTKPIYGPGCVENVDNINNDDSIVYHYQICANTHFSTRKCGYGCSVGSELISLRYMLIGHHGSVYQQVIMYTLVFTVVKLFLVFHDLLRNYHFTIRRNLSQETIQSMQIIDQPLVLAENIFATLKKTTQSRASTQQTLSMRSQHRHETQQHSHATAVGHIHANLKQAIDVTQERERQFLYFVVLFLFFLFLRILATVVSAILYSTLVRIDWDVVLSSDCPALASSMHTLHDITIALICLETTDWVLFVTPFLVAHIQFK